MNNRLAYEPARKPDEQRPQPLLLNVIATARDNYQYPLTQMEPEKAGKKEEQQM